ncbi:TPA: hypothetical protein PXM26_003962 [Yersinia enterocolitica]|nr:hypothetical protein [Yersinia enterocolitica]
MKKYIRVNSSGLCAELLETDKDITLLFHPAMQWIDITKAKPQPDIDWHYDGNEFTLPVERKSI